MTVYTFSEARQRFASLLEQARREGAVQIRRRDGQTFVVQPQRRDRSPLDVPGIKTDITTDEIVDIIREMRETARGLPKLKRSTRSPRKRKKEKAR